MAVKTQTIEYAYASLSSISSGVDLDFTAITVFIPQTTSRTFKSVMGFISMTDQCTTGGLQITDATLSLNIGASGYHAIDDETPGPSGLITTSGENSGFCIMLGDFATFFNDHFGSGASASVNARLNCVFATGSPLTANNVTLKLVITFEADDQAATKIKTIRIPLESPATSLTTTLSEIPSAGSNQVPLLDTFLPEASKTYRDIFFEIFANQDHDTTDTGDFALHVSLDSEAEVAADTIEQALGSSSTFFWIWKRTDMATNAVHAFKAHHTGASGYRFHCPSIMLVVTYEYDEANTTTVMNEKLLPVWMPTPVPRTLGTLERRSLDFWVEEPGTITLVQSAVALRYSMSGGYNTNHHITVGAQSDYSYITSASAQSRQGQCGVHHRIDAGGVRGAGVTLARGKNTITINNYVEFTGQDNLHVPTALVILNYTSGKTTQSGGTSNHSRPIMWYNRKSQAPDSGGPPMQVWTADGPNFSETNYLLDGVGMLILNNESTAHSTFGAGAQYLSGEGPAAGWEPIYADRGSGSTENGAMWRWVHLGQFFKRWTGDPDSNRMDLKTAARGYRQFTGTYYYDYAFMFMFNMSNIAFTVAGTITGYTGDGSGLTVDLVDTLAHEHRLTTTTAAGGTYSVTWFDSARNLFPECQQDATHCGRGANAVAE